ncbi:MAG TPA: radical SAM protein [Herpetosiphonaceae bacterium]|nr:radical SAM protein [Herpetosiphonaceae bacterium]
MDAEQKLQLLSEDARFESCDSFMPRRPKKRSAKGGGQAQDGTSTALFRVLQSNSCEWDCPYCPLRRSNDVARATLEPEELARLFMARAEAGTVDGLFLSSAVADGLRPAMRRMLDTVELLRVRYAYAGYVHLKLMPGTRPDEIERATTLADRVSINLEAPNGERLKQIAPERRWASIIEPMREVHLADQEGKLASGQATQLVVGAANESDREVVSATTRMYTEFAMRRVYFNAFRPQPGTPMADHDPTPFVRQQRLQEADWLMRHYGFKPDELPFDGDDNLPLQLDPKFAWALAHPERFPVEVNTAEPEDLLRVPGIGPISLQRILAMRRTVRFREVDHVRKLGVVAEKARHFLLFDGRYLGGDVEAVGARLRARPIAEQLTLW